VALSIGLRWRIESACGGDFIGLGRQCDGQRLATLQNVLDACNALAGVRGKSSDLTLAAIERWVKTHRGPKASPTANHLTNSKYEEHLSYWHYVEARKRDLAPRQSKQSVFHMVESIEDPDQRNRTRGLLDEVVVLRKKHERAKELFRILKPGVDIDEVLDSWEGRKPMPIPAPGTLVRSEHIKSLEGVIKSLTDAKGLDRCSLVFDGSKVLRKGSGDILVRPGVVDGLLSLHRALVGEPEPKAEASLG
jgi:hypothetical protein